MIIKKMAETTSGNSTILEKALKMQPDGVLAKIGMSKDLIISPPKTPNEQRSDRWREEKSDQNTPPRYNPPHRKNLETQYATNHDNPLFENRRERNQDNNFNRHNNQRAWNNGPHNRGIQQNIGNNRQPYVANQNNNNQNRQGYVAQNQGNRNQVMRQPMAIERYRQLDFIGIQGYPNPISNDLRNAIPKFSGNGTESAERHVINLKNIIEDFEEEHEDVFMKLFVQSLKIGRASCRERV